MTLPDYTRGCHRLPVTADRTGPRIAHYGIRNTQHDKGVTHVRPQESHPARALRQDGEGHAPHHDHLLRLPDGLPRRAGRHRHRPRRRQPGHDHARLRFDPARDDGRHDPPRRRRPPRHAQRLADRRHALHELPGLGRIRRAQRRPLHGPGRLRRHQARRRHRGLLPRQGDRQRRHPRDGPPRPHARRASPPSAASACRARAPNRPRRSSTTPRPSKRPAPWPSCSNSCPIRSAA